MIELTKTYVPAAGHNWLLPFYDLLLRICGGRSALERLIDHCAIARGERVLDVGCGTGTLVCLMKKRHPQAYFVGLDPDPPALARARRKLDRAGVDVEFTNGFADDLPFPDGSFDRVVSSLMFHHLQLDEKQRMLREIRRVLKPGGAFHILDFAPTEQRSGGFFARLLHTDGELMDNADGRIPALMQGAGFADVREIDQRKTIFGRIAYFYGLSPKNNS